MTPVPADLHARAAAVIQDFDAQGNHRTGSDVDMRSAHWLAERVRSLGFEADLVPFDMDRVSIIAAHLSTDECRIDGVPLFDCGFTDADGVQGQIGAFGSDAQIGVLSTRPYRSSDRHEPFTDLIRRSAHQAVIVLTDGRHPGLSLENAQSFLQPKGPPTIQISSTHTETLERLIAGRCRASLVAHAERVRCHPVNVIVHLRSETAEKSPLIISTPRSGWWQCASERGGGLVAWLEAMAAMRGRAIHRDCIFAAFTGHELGKLGALHFLKAHPECVRDDALWMHFGANIGGYGKGGTLYSSDDAVQAVVTRALTTAGVRFTLADRAVMPVGEVGIAARQGARYAGFIGESDWFHHANDRWPESVDVAEVARYAWAMARAAVLCASDAD